MVTQVIIGIDHHFSFLFRSIFGCRSIQMKSQLASFTEKGKIPVLDFLSAALESAEYERALTRAIVSGFINQN